MTATLTAMEVRRLVEQTRNLADAMELAGEHEYAVHLLFLAEEVKRKHSGDDAHVWVSMSVTSDADDPQVCAHCGATRKVPQRTALREQPDVQAMHAAADELSRLGQELDAETPQTGGGPAEPPEADPPPPHRWLTADHDGGRCYCRIGCDHVSPPQFEKES